MQRERKRVLVSLRAERESESVVLVVILGCEGRELWRSCWTDQERLRSSVKSSKSVGERLSLIHI